MTWKQRDYTIRDAVLTPKGKEQCRALKSTFPYHEKVDIIFASPLRRTIQTAALSFGPALARQEVPFVLLPILQEVSNIGCDVGIADTAEDIKGLLPGLFDEAEVSFDLNKIDASAVTKGWNSKVCSLDLWFLELECIYTNAFQKGYWAYNKEAISKRAADLRNWLFQRSETHVSSRFDLT